MRRSRWASWASFLRGEGVEAGGRGPNPVVGYAMEPIREGDTIWVDLNAIGFQPLFPERHREENPGT